MYKYVKFNEDTGLCTEVGEGTNTEFYKSIGMVRKDVEQSEIDGCWYLKAKCPHYTDEEKAELEQIETDKQSQLDLQSQLSMVKADIETATILENEDWLKELKAAYSKLINNSGKTPYVYTRTRCSYCGSDKLTEKYEQSWCKNCEAGKLDLKLYEETHEVDEETKDEDEEVNEK